MRWTEQEWEDYADGLRQARIRPERKEGGDFIIIAIDPGNEQSAFVVWDGKRIYEKGIVSNYDLLAKLGQDTHYGKTYRSAIEMVASYGMAVGKTVFDTCVWIGRFIEVSFSHSLVYRKDVKMCLCGSMRAKDANIRQALIDKFGKPGTIKAPNLVYGETNRVEDKMKADLWSALAVAVTWHDLNIKT